MNNKQKTKGKNTKNTNNKKTKKKMKTWKKVLIILLLIILIIAAYFIINSIRIKGEVSLSGMLATAVGHDENTRKKSRRISSINNGSKYRSSWS